MKIVYFTSGPRERVLKALLDHGFDIRLIVTTPVEKTPKIKPTLALASTAGIPVKTVQSKKELIPSELGLEKSDLLLSVGFAYLFSEQFLNSVSLALNVHGTLLPDYPGARSLNWIIENGESTSGVTIHKIDSGMDTGPVLLQERFAVSKFDTGQSLMRKTLEFEPQVVVRALELLKSGASFSPQRTTDIKHFPDRTPSDSEIDPTKSLLELYNKIRAAHPVDYPAHFYLDGEKISVVLRRVVRPRGEEDML
jgi:methionyl-tRNA formyltransferase